MTMSINIKQHAENMRLDIEEVWEFKTEKEFMECLNQILDLKKKYGKITGFKRK